MRLDTYSNPIPNPRRATPRPATSRPATSGPKTSRPATLGWAPRLFFFVALLALALVSFLPTAPAWAQGVPIYFSDCSENPGTVWEYDPSTGSTSSVYTRPGDRISGFAFAPWDRDLLYYVDANQTEIFSADVTGATAEQLVYSHWTYVDDVAFDGNQLYFSESTGAGGDGYIYRLESNGSASLFFTVQLSEIDYYWGGNFTFAADGSLWLTSGNTSGGGYYEADLSSGALSRRFDGAMVGMPNLTLTGLSFGPDGQPYVANFSNEILRLDPSLPSSSSAFYTWSWWRICNTGFRPALPPTPAAGGSWVMPQAIGTTLLDRVQQPSGLLDYTDSLSGLTMKGAPFAGRLGFQINADSAVPTSSVYYYRFSYRPSGSSGAWVDFTEPVSVYYVRHVSGQYPTFSTLSLGPFQVNGQQLYRFRPHAWELPYLVPSGAGTVAWPKNPIGGDQYRAFLDTTALPAGPYDVRFEVFDQSGNLNPGATFQMLLPDGAASGTSIPTQPAPMTAGGYEFKLYLDNRPASAQIHAPKIGTNSTDSCGFLRYPLANPGQVELSWQAWQPGGFALYSFFVKHGNGSVPVWLQDEVVSSFHNGVNGEFYDFWSISSLLNGCSEAAFAASLYTYAKATNGNGQRMNALDASDLRAFAIAPH